MRELAVKSRDFNKVSEYMLEQKAYWYPQEVVIYYKGESYKMFYIDRSSPHVSYLMLKYDIDDFTDMLSTNYQMRVINESVSNI